jgi:2-hydroxymuconate-semialdehyde hydrolase
LRTSAVIDAESTSRTVEALGITTHYHDAGSGPPLLLLHGSGPGVSAWSNWRPVYPELSRRFRVIAPDQVGFNRTQAEGDVAYGRALWTDHAFALLDALGIERCSVIGNSMGGAIALSMAAAAPERIDRIVTMGTMGVAMALPDGLAAVWGYEPSPEAMREIIELFAYDHWIVTDELVRTRYEASADPVVRDAFAAMFPAPRQRGVDELSLSADELRALDHPVLLAHGYHDRIVPLASSSLPLMDLLPNAQLHVFGNSGHWVMIEETDAFGAVVLAHLGPGT